MQIACSVRANGTLKPKRGRKGLTRQNCTFNCCPCCSAAFCLINIVKTSPAGRHDDPALCTRIISRPQQEREPAALAHHSAASCLTFSTSSFMFTTQQWYPKIDSLTQACTHACGIYTHAHLQSLFCIFFTSSLTLSLVPDAVGWPLCSGPVLHSSPRCESNH